MGCNTEFAFAQLLDVDSSDGRALCSTISEGICQSPILAWNFYVHAYIALFVEVGW